MPAHFKLRLNLRKILLTGASAYIENKSNEQNVTWKSSDLFDLNEITEVMKT